MEKLELAGALYWNTDRRLVLVTDEGVSIDIEDTLKRALLVGTGIRLRVERVGNEQA